MSRTMVVDGGYNLRDLGDQPTRNGRRTLRGLLLRGGNLDGLSVTGRQQLLDYGVRTVIDLRDEWEVEQYPTPFSQSVVACAYCNLPLIGARLSADPVWEAETQTMSLEGLYAHYLDRCRTQIAAIVAAVVDSAPATLFHCYAGKDRTGIIAALLLGAVGVTDDAIVEDYAQTAAQITHLAEAWRAHARATGYDLARLEHEIDSQPSTMRSMLDHLNTRYGGVVDYLLACGVTTTQLSVLQQRFVG